MAAGADHDGRLELAAVGRDASRAGRHAHAGHSHAAAHVGSGGRGALEEVVIELAAKDAVAGRARPARLVARALEGQPAGREGLDGERVLRRIDLDVGERGGCDPPGADLDAGKHGGVEHERPPSRRGQAPRRGAATGSAADHDGVVRHARPLCRRARRAAGPMASNSRSRWASGRRSSSSALATCIAANMSPSMSMAPPT